MTNNKKTVNVYFLLAYNFLQIQALNFDPTVYWSLKPLV